MNKITACLIGCAIGDSLGVFVEMKSADHHLLKNWDGSFQEGGTFRRHNKKGEWSDDTVCSMILAESFIQHKDFNPEDIAQRYVAWHKTGDFRGAGSTTCHAISRLKYGKSWKESGLEGDECGGNGTSMRASPIGIFFRNDLNKLVQTAITEASITHNNREPKVGSVAIAYAASWLMNNPEAHKNDVMLATIECISQLGSSKVLDNLKKTNEILHSGIEPKLALKQIGVSGWVVHNVSAALYCFCRAENFRDSVVMAVRAGGDTDSNAAVCGSLAGIWYGLDAIPQEYKDGVEDFEKLSRLDKELIDCSV